MGRGFKDQDEAASGKTPKQRLKEYNYDHGYWFQYVT